MAKVFESLEARFCALLFDEFAAQASGGKMFSLLLSSVKNLVVMIDGSESGQAKVREIMGYICEHWPEWEGMEVVDACGEGMPSCFE